MRLLFAAPAEEPFGDVSGLFDVDEAEADQGHHKAQDRHPDVARDEASVGGDHRADRPQEDATLGLVPGSLPGLIALRDFLLDRALGEFGVVLCGRYRSVAMAPAPAVEFSRSSVQPDGR